VDLGGGWLLGRRAASMVTSSFAEIDGVHVLSVKILTGVDLDVAAYGERSVWHALGLCGYQGRRHPLWPGHGGPPGGTE